jgi:hypothetical protein
MEKDNNTDIMRGVYTQATEAAKVSNRELNAMEKAATFVGWKPNDPCVGGIISYDGYCIHGNYGTCDQFQSAPDMQIPNNYMGAILGVLNFEITRDDDLFTVFLDDGDLQVMKLSDNLSTAAISALAMLHDRRVKRNGNKS